MCLFFFRQSAANRKRLHMMCLQTPLFSIFGTSLFITPLIFYYHMLLFTEVHQAKISHLQEHYGGFNQEEKLVYSSFRYLLFYRMCWFINSDVNMSKHFYNEVFLYYQHVRRYNLVFKKKLYSLQLCQSNNYMCRRMSMYQTKSNIRIFDRVEYYIV